VRLLQYRRKALSWVQAQAEASALQALATANGAKLIVNDNLELAISVGAHGVHWGREDVSSDSPLLEQIETARKRAAEAGCPPDFVVGISCYNDFDLAQRAAMAGADYVAFGSMFASPTKPHAASAPTSLISRAKQSFDTPVVAIGGITRDNARQLLDAGVDAVAVISDIFDAVDDNERVARAACYRAMFMDRALHSRHAQSLQ
jgi:thiamine-phosphate pyrophosphorylase